MNTTPTAAAHDPVCEAIEALLQDFETQGRGLLEKRLAPGAVELRFGKIHVESYSYDIALVRLARAMMDEDRYRDTVMDALREPMLASP